jgi:S1-C subfamily serine protease
MGHAYGVRAAPSLGFCAGFRSDGAMQFSVQSAPTTLGGGVFNLSGDLLGMVVGRIGRDQGVTIALPAYSLPALVYQLLNNGDRHSGFVGITTQEVEISPPVSLPMQTQMASYSGRTVDVIERGLLVTSIVPSSPAQKAGLLPGDLIFSVNAVPVNSAAGLAGFVKQSPPGVTLDMEVLRRDSYESLQLVVARKSLYLESPPAVNPQSAAEAREIDSLRQALHQVMNQVQHLQQRLDDLE